MDISLSDHFNYKKLLRFTLPSMIMMVFTSIYSVVDGFFVSNFCHTTEFAAINLIMPFLMILGAVGFMLGAGGSALVSKTLGEGDAKKANEIFSLIVYVSIAVGLLLSAVGIIFMPTVARLFGAEGFLLERAVVYGRIILSALTAFILQMEFQSFFITAEKPQLGLAVTVASGVANMVLDALLVGILGAGLEGAAIATAVSQCIGAIAPIVYFSRKNKSLLRLCRTKMDGTSLLKTCTNGSSELMSNIAFSVVGILYNFQLLRYEGESGVAAYGVLMYVGMIFNAIFIGYSIGVAPVVGYHFGAENKRELRGLLRKSCVIIGIFSVCMLGAAFFLSSPMSRLFVGYDEYLFRLTARGFKIYSLSFLFMGFAIYFSSFFTALNDGLTSALISFLRTLVFQTAAVMLMPLIFGGIDGVWWSVVAAEVMAVAISLFFVFIKRKKYGY